MRADRRRRDRAALAVLLAVIVSAHVALWSSPQVPDDVKWRLTLLNAAGWAVVLLPVIGVTMWAKAHRRPGGTATHDPFERNEDVTGRDGGAG